MNNPYDNDDAVFAILAVVIFCIALLATLYSALECGVSGGQVWFECV